MGISGKATIRDPSPQHKPPHNFAKITEPYDRIALVLQGGGALGSYQAGVYEALHENKIPFNWVAGVSIGAINAALIAGNSYSDRLDALKSFWSTVAPPDPWYAFDKQWRALLPEVISQPMHNQLSALRTIMLGQPGFFRPRLPPWIGELSIYDTTPLKATLERLIDFDRINSGEMRLALGAVNVRTGNYIYFDNATQTIGPEHVMASGALPPGLPAVEIDGEFYWDGGLVSNTPLQHILDNRDDKNTLVFQVDLWSATGIVPTDLQSVTERQKDIVYSSRTRLNTDRATDKHGLSYNLSKLIEKLPPELHNEPEVVALRKYACPSVLNIIHLIYQRHAFDSANKDYEFSNDSMHDHWKCGRDDTAETLQHANWLSVPKNQHGIVTHDRLRG